MAGHLACVVVHVWWHLGAGVQVQLEVGGRGAGPHRLEAVHDQLELASGAVDGLLANLAVAAGVGGGPFLEFPHDPPGWTPERRDFMLAEPVWIDASGMVPVPQTPGLGIVLDEGAIQRFAA